MDDIPKELEENELSLQVIIDPETKCFTMKTHTDELSESFDIPAGIIPNDPLHYSEIEDVDFEKMNELDRLIYSERQRILNLKKMKKDSIKERKTKDNSYYVEIFETDSYQELTQNEKSKLRMRKLREKESSEEREFRRFRVRVVTMKLRLMQKLRNFEDETPLKEMSKRNTDRIKQKRMEIRANETPAQRALRKSSVNMKSRLIHIRRKAFQTPEEILAEKEKRASYMQKVRSRHTDEQHKAKLKLQREKAKERRRRDQKEWKKIQMAIKGAPIEDSAIESQLIKSVGN